MPTNVTGMLKYGTNLLQAVGQFKGMLEHKPFYFLKVHGLLVSFV